MTQQELYDLCISYGSCLEAYVVQKIQDIKNGEGPDDAFFCELLIIERELKENGVKVDIEKTRKYIDDRLKEVTK